MTMATDLITRVNGGSATPQALPAGGQSILYSRTWHGRILGVTVSAQLSIIAQGTDLVFRMTVDVGNQAKTWSFAINSNTTQQVALPYGLTLILAISNWSATATQVAFDLNVRIAVPVPLVPPATLANEHVSFAVPTAEDLQRMAVIPTSPADFLAIMQLSGAIQPAALGTLAGNRQLSSQSGPGATPLAASSPSPLTRPAAPLYAVTGKMSPAAQGQIRELASGTYNYGSNTSDNVQVNAIMLPIGSQRVGNADVFLSPGSNGWCTFLRWYDESDPTDGRFFFHVGADFWHGGGTVNWVINGYPAPTY
jgi:hypothetical protein